jgi:hypothetical protein
MLSARDHVIDGSLTNLKHVAALECKAKAWDPTLRLRLRLIMVVVRFYL